MECNCSCAGTTTSEHEQAGGTIVHEARLRSQAASNLKIVIHISVYVVYSKYALGL
jgi:hypothetical protein